METGRIREIRIKRGCDGRDGGLSRPSVNIVIVLRSSSSRYLRPSSIIFVVIYAVIHIRGSSYFPSIDDVPMISEIVLIVFFSRRDAKGDPVAFSQRVPLTDVVMTFFLRAARSAGPVRPS